MEGDPPRDFFNFSAVLEELLRTRVGRRAERREVAGLQGFDEAVLAFENTDEIPRDIEGRTQENGEIASLEDLNEADFNEADFNEADFNEADFNEADFNEPDFNYEDLNDEDFSDEDFNDADFNDADFNEADFNEADFSEADFNEAVLASENLVEILRVSEGRTTENGEVASLQNFNEEVSAHENTGETLRGSEGRTTENREVTSLEENVEDVSCALDSSTAGLRDLEENAVKRDDKTQREGIEESKPRGEAETSRDESNEKNCREADKSQSEEMS